MSATTYAIEDLIPHRKPFLWVDRIVACDAQGGAFEKAVSATDPLTTAGAFPRPLVVEAMAQAAAAFLGWETRAQGGIPGSGVLASLDGFEFSGDARPGDVVRLEARRTRTVGPVMRFEAIARVGERILASGTLTIALE